MKNTRFFKRIWLANTKKEHRIFKDNGVLIIFEVTIS